MLSCLIALLAAWQPARADDDDEGDHEGGFAGLVEELFAVELAQPQEAAEFQITLATGFSSGDLGERLDGVLEVEFGLTDWLQISAGLPAAAAWPPGPGDATAGLGDVEVGALAAFSPSPAVILALAVEAGLPTGEPAVGAEGEWRAEPSLRAAVDLAPVQLHGIVALGIGDELEIEAGLGAAIGVAPSWVVSFEALAEAEDEALSARLVPGVAWVGLDDIELGVGGVVFVGDAAADWGAVARFVAEF